MTELSPMPKAFVKFILLPTIHGFDVIDVQSGHAVDHRDERRQAAGVAYKLNTAAECGQLVGALHAGSERVTRV